MFVFNKVHVGEDLLTYVSGSEDRQDPKCILFHVHVSVGDGIPCLTGLGRFSTSLHL